jgi:hypothetical protein
LPVTVAVDVKMLVAFEVITAGTARTVRVVIESRPPYAVPAVFTAYARR